MTMLQCRRNERVWLVVGLSLVCSVNVQVWHRVMLGQSGELRERSGLYIAAVLAHAAQQSSRVVQKDRACQPEFLSRGLPFLRCKIHCSGSSTTLQFALSCATRRLEGCAGCGRSARSRRRGGAIHSLAHPLFRVSSLVGEERRCRSALQATVLEGFRLHQFVPTFSKFPFVSIAGTKEKNVGMGLDALKKS